MSASVTYQTLVIAFERAEACAEPATLNYIARPPAGPREARLCIYIIYICARARKRRAFDGARISSLRAHARKHTIYDKNVA